MECSTCSTESCRCVSNFKEAIFLPRPIWTLGGTSGSAATTTVLEDVGVMDVAPTISQMQATITVSNASAHFKCKASYRLSSDGVSWGNAVDFGAPDYQIGNGSLTTAWNAVGGNYRKKIRFEVVAEQDGGANVIEIANVAVTIGIRIQ